MFDARSGGTTAIAGVAAIAAAVALAACGSTTRTVSVEHDATTVVRQAPAHTTTVVQTPSPSTTVVEAPASSDDYSAGVSLRSCDQNISASPDASCSLAENVFYDLWEQSNDDIVADTDQDVDAYSPVSQQTFTFECAADSTTETCTSESDSSDVVTFANSAVYAYTQAEANAYAGSHDVE